MENSWTSCTLQLQGLLHSDWAEKQKNFLAPIRTQKDRDRLELGPLGLSSLFFTFLCVIYSNHLDFPSPPLSAPGSLMSPPPSQEKKVITHPLLALLYSLQPIFNNYSSEPECALSQFGLTGYWLRGHEGEKKNCFSKIQLVGQKYRE